MLKTRFIKMNHINKLIYTLIDIIHISICIVHVYLIIILLIDILMNRYNQNNLYIINMITFIIIFCFFIFKNCILSLLSITITNNQINNWISPLYRFLYLFDRFPYNYNNRSNFQTMHNDFMNTWKYIIALIIFINGYYFFKLYYKNKKILIFK